MRHDEQATYSRGALTGLIYGEAEDDEGLVKSRATWADLRSACERTGDVESEAMQTVLDVERALRMMGSRPLEHRRELRTVREARQAAALISAQLLLDWDVMDFRAAFRRTSWDTDRLTRKGIAWMAAYLSGRTLTEADLAFRRCK